MKTNRATGFALVAAFACFGGLAIMPGCSGNQADVVEPDDGGGSDATVPLTGDGGATADTGSTGIPDTGSTFIDSGSTTAPDTGTTADTGTVTGTDSGTCPPASCTADSDCGCLTASGSIGCCDTVTMACFQSASSQCPDVGAADAGGGTGY